jgi:hypothetical protein
LAVYVTICPFNSVPYDVFNWCVFQCSNFFYVGSLALPDHIVRAPFAVPLTGDGLIANGSS